MKDMNQKRKEPKENRDCISVRLWNKPTDRQAVNNLILKSVTGISRPHCHLIHNYNVIIDSICKSLSPDYRLNSNRKGHVIF